MSAPLRVAVVRPKKNGAQATGFFLGRILGSFLVAWLLMLIAGTVTDWGLGYWHSLLILLAVRMLQVGSGWSLWTRQEKGSWL